jgi:CspA family cold shock protein
MASTAATFGLVFFREWSGGAFLRAFVPPCDVRMAAMPQGVIKKLVSDRGFGFITAEGGDIFFHHSSVTEAVFDDLQEGQPVEYELEEDGGGSRGRGKGPRAASVKIV